MAKSAKFLGTAAALVALALSCGEPLGPLEPRWAKFDGFPAGCNVLALSASPWGDGTLRAVARNAEYKYVILKYFRGEFTEEYVCPYEYDQAWVADVAFGGSQGWAVGGKRRGNVRVPLVLRYGGADAGWLELEMPAGAEGVVSAAYPTAADRAVWFLIDKDYDEGEFLMNGLRKGTLARYSQGELKFYEKLGRVTAALSSDPRAAGVVYAVSCPLKEYSEGEEAVIFVSGDNGGTWAEEKLRRDHLLGYEINWVRAVGVDSADLYLLAGLEPHGFMGLIKRTGAPGVGVYGLVFLARYGPYFNELRGMAFHDPTGSTAAGGAEAVAVGDETCVVRCDGRFYQEVLPYPVTMTSVTYAGGTGFWATARNKVIGGYELWYHP